MNATAGAPHYELVIHSAWPYLRCALHVIQGLWDMKAAPFPLNSTAAGTQEPGHSSDPCLET